MSRLGIPPCAEGARVTDDLSAHLGRNIRQLRGARGLTQAQVARLAGLPRATWANLESGTANPTLEVLRRVATALQLSIEELLSRPRSPTRLYPRASLPERTPQGALVRRLLPDKLPGIDLERLELAPYARMTGVPHTPGTREYLTCESAALTLEVGGESFPLAEGDVVVFRGDQRHAYRNPTGRRAIGYSIVLLAPMG
jgi:transcriptional regulator with XRE-family HTH domain